MGMTVVERRVQTVDRSASAGLPEGAGLPRLTSESLLRGSRELLIEHQGELYRLRLTGNNKLILTK